MKVKSFSHSIYYDKNEFQHITLTLETDRGIKVLRGTYSLMYENSYADTQRTPATVFTALQECVDNGVDFKYEIDEPAMFQIQVTLRVPDHYFIFDCRELKENSKQEG